MVTKKMLFFRHVLVWALFITYEIAYVRFTVGVSAGIMHYLIFYALNISLFYFNAHVVLDYAFFKTGRPYVSAILLILLEIAGYLILKFLVDYMISPAIESLIAQVKEDQKYVLTNIWRGVYFIGFSIAYWSMIYMIQYKERNHRMEREQLTTLARALEMENKLITVENAYLQNQISPHLLFNSLNFIYNQVYKESAEAGDSVSRLSELMRYSLVSADEARLVGLDQEVKQLENLVELCRMRFREHFYLRFLKKGKLAGHQIIPLVLITLVENMMKHGDLGDKKQPARITLEVSETRLQFTTHNKIRNTHLYPKTGLGLKNIEKRLGNFYQGRYHLLAGTEDEIFTTNLTIDL